MAAKKATIPAPIPQHQLESEYLSAAQKKVFGRAKRAEARDEAKADTKAESKTDTERSTKKK
jgi:1,6-anhydro-N-acetylmuramate kinase